MLSKHVYIIIYKCAIIEEGHILKVYTLQRKSKITVSVKLLISEEGNYLFRS